VAAKEIAKIECGKEKFSVISVVIAATGFQNDQQKHS
jgi:hypothetical protein